MKTISLIVLLSFSIFSQSLQVASGSYTGTLDTLAITGLGFAPEFVMVKVNFAQYPAWKRTDHTADSSAIGSGADIRDAIISLDANGFTVGLSLTVQIAATTSRWVAMAGSFLATGRIVGLGTSNTTVTLGWQPGLIIAKRHDTGESIIKMSENIGDSASVFIAGEQPLQFAIEATGFRNSNNNRVAGKKTSYIAIKDDPLYFADTTYVGDGLDSRDFATLFSSEVVVIKRSNSAIPGAFKTTSGHSGEITSRLANSTDLATNSIQTITASLFQVGTDATVNVSGGKYKGFYLKTLTLPTVTTTAITTITSTTATSGGNATSDGGGTVTARGVCWNTSGSPTTADSKTTDGTGTGAFTSSITGLTANTTYYVRAYATNTAGTSYGSELSFISLPSSVDSGFQGNKAYSKFKGW